MRVPTDFQDYYAILGVPRKATPGEIKSAFRKLARKYHPDLHPGDKTAETRFKEVNEAYEVLGDPEKRKKYDQLGPQWQQWERAGAPGGSPFGPGSPFGKGDTRVEYRNISPDDLEQFFGGRSGQPFSSFFHTMFGTGSPGAAPASPPTRGSDATVPAEITLEEALTGTKRTVELRENGKLRRVEVSIPAGVTDGAKVRAKGQAGAGGSGGPSGDLIVTVSIAPHPVFRREGSNLYTRVAVPLATAIAGGTAAAPTLKGSRVQVRVPPGTQNGTRLRLKGMGMPSRGGGSGDLIAEVDIKLPDPCPPELAAWAARAAAKLS